MKVGLLGNLARRRGANPRKAKGICLHQSQRYTLGKDKGSMSDSACKEILPHHPASLPK